MRASWRQLGPLSSECYLFEKTLHRHPGPSKIVFFQMENVGLQQNSVFRSHLPKVALGRPSRPLVASLRPLLSSCGPRFAPKLAPSWPMLPSFDPTCASQVAPDSAQDPPECSQGGPGRPRDPFWGGFFIFFGVLWSTFWLSAGLVARKRFCRKPVRPSAGKCSFTKPLQHPTS